MDNVMNKREPMKRYTLNIGLKDKDTKEVINSPREINDVIHSVMGSFEVGFNVTLQQGGYQHDEGMYIFEPSLTISMIDVPEETVLEIAEKFRETLNQESVLVTQDLINVFEIRE